MLKEIDDNIRAYEEDPVAYTMAEQKPKIPVTYVYAEYLWPGISMKDVSRDTGLTHGAVSRIFNGRRRARPFTLRSIANIYTDGDVAKVQAVIKARVLKKIRTEGIEGQTKVDMIRRVTW